MLVPSRKSGQKIVLDHDITITVAVDGQRVKLGIEAPDSVRVLRAELYGQFDAPRAGGPAADSFPEFATSC